MPVLITRRTWARDAWVPRPGPKGVYCSPACGGGCTRAAWRKATARANLIARRLNAQTGNVGKWTPAVFENCRWFAKAERRIGRRKEVVARVDYDESSNDYSAEVRVAGRQFWGRDRSPVLAFKFAMSAAREEAETILSELGKI